MKNTIELTTTTAAAPLVALAQARCALEHVTTIPDAIRLRGLFASFSDALKRRGASLDLQNDAAEARLDAERWLGAELAKIAFDRGGRPSETGNTRMPVLSDFGVTKVQSSRWQREASLPPEAYELWLADIRAARDEITTAGLLDVASAWRSFVRFETRASGNEPSQSELIGKWNTFLAWAADMRADADGVWAKARVSDLWAAWRSEHEGDVPADQDDEPDDAPEQSPIKADEAERILHHPPHRCTVCGNWTACEPVR